MLDVHGRLSLHREADQTQGESNGSIGVLAPRLVLGLALWIAAQTAYSILNAFIFVFGVAAQQRRTMAVALDEFGAEIGGHGGLVVFIPVVKGEGVARTVCYNLGA